jgi:hypothetical protein
MHNEPFFSARNAAAKRQHMEKRTEMRLIVVIDCKSTTSRAHLQAFRHLILPCDASGHHIPTPETTRGHADEGMPRAGEIHDNIGTS